MPPTWATYADLVEYVPASVDVIDAGEAGKLLVRAHRVVRLLAAAAFYVVDDQDAPTDADVAAALRDAVCAQVEWWVTTGDLTGADGQWQRVTLGPATLDRGTASTRDRAAPDVVAILSTIPSVVTS